TAPSRPASQYPPPFVFPAMPMMFVTADCDMSPYHGGTGSSAASRTARTAPPSVTSQDPSPAGPAGVMPTWYSDCACGVDEGTPPPPPFLMLFPAVGWIPATSE